MKKVEHIFLVLLVVVFLMAAIDFALAQTNKRPFFSCLINKSEVKKDGGSMSCNGIGYYVDIVSELDAEKGFTYQVEYNFGFKK